MFLSEFFQPGQSFIDFGAVCRLQMVDVKNAVQMIQFVLDAARQHAAAFDVDGIAVQRLCFEPAIQRPG